MDFHQWFNYYQSRLDLPGCDRGRTMRRALEMFLDRKGSRIVETGCTRMKDDWGAGNSTIILCEFVSKFGGCIATIDNSSKNIQFCQQNIVDIHGPEFTLFSAICSDSVTALRNEKEKIDLLYLDSFDYPDHEIAMKFNKDYNIGWSLAKEQDSDFILREYEDILLPCQEHCYKELMSSLHLLHDNSIILIDDNLPGGGKGRLARNYLLSNGWVLELEGYQSIFVRKNDD